MSAFGPEVEVRGCGSHRALAIGLPTGGWRRFLILLGAEGRGKEANKDSCRRAIHHALGSHVRQRRRIAI